MSDFYLNYAAHTLHTVQPNTVFILTLHWEIVQIVFFLVLSKLLR